MTKTDQSSKAKQKIQYGHSIINMFVPELGGHLGGTIMQLSVAGNF